ncbi:MAG: hypothetical protein AB8B91_22275 [Rubripirellula sp.]
MMKSANASFGTAACLTILFCSMPLATVSAQHSEPRIVSPSDHDASWQHQVPLHDSPEVHSEHHELQPLHGQHTHVEQHGEHGHHAGHGDHHAESMHAAESSACNCGHKGCHGVCRDPGRPEKPKREMPGDVNRGDCPPHRYGMPDCQRAGNPHAVHRFAKCSVDGKYSSWFVGGGAAFFRGRCRKPSEGTWGMDYSGLFGKANVWMNYTRDREQGGEGAYETDGEPEFVSKVHGFLGLGH